MGIKIGIYFVEVAFLKLGLKFPGTVFGSFTLEHLTLTNSI